MKNITNRINLLLTHGRYKTVPKKRIAEDMVLSLKLNEIFIFGSNLSGHHAGGAASYARKNFGAMQGISTGRSGRTYAIPTLTQQYEKLSIEGIHYHIEEFISYAHLFPHMTFKVSAIGCGIAGFTVEEIAPLFQKAITVKNIQLPEIFWEHLI